VREVKLDPNWDVPSVNVLLKRPRGRSRRAKLVFDTGASLTQIDVDLMEALGYSARDAIGTARIRGATGEPVEGYIVRLSSLTLLGRELRDISVFSYDFKNFSGLDGLLGWDVIKRLHLELDGPNGVLKVF
jgi:predicted aspartyl protease